MLGLIFSSRILSWSRSYQQIYLFAFEVVFNVKIIFILENYNNDSQKMVLKSTELSVKYSKGINN